MSISVHMFVSFTLSTMTLLNSCLSQVKTFLNTEVFGLNGPAQDYAGIVSLGCCIIMHLLYAA